jgi:TorA maturation chaperone TorD
MRLNSEVAAALAEDASTLAVLQDRELTPAVLAELKALDFPENLSLLLTDDAGRKVSGMMRAVVAALPGESDVAFLDDLAVDYAAIYLTGAFGASPYESYWLSDDHLICQDAMFDLRTLYSEAGLTVPNWRMRPDDHLVFQLQFLAHRLPKADGDEDWCSLAGFLDYHLLRWLPDFASRVVSRCDTPFYAALALLTDAWCQQLRGLIEQHLGEARLTAKEVEERHGLRRIIEVKEVPITIRQTAELLGKGRFHSLPVIDENENVVGIVTTTDLIHYLSELY